MQIGIVGKPNVGKSTFFKALTLADAEIANFPFTTINPNVGVGYFRTECACKEFGVTCNPKNSICVNKNRFIPIKIIDVAGLVPGAHEGKGLGNQFLDDLRQADALVHIVDISGKTNEKGEVVASHDPEYDIKFLEEEINLWFFGILKRNWGKITSKSKYEGSDFVKEVAGQLAGLGINENQIHQTIREAGLPESADWSDDQLKEFSFKLREISKPIIIAANKIDVDEGNFERLKDKYRMIPTCSDAELALRQADKAGLIEYLAGDSDFKTLKNLDEKQTKALGFIKEKILKKFGSTGVQQCLNEAATNILNQIVVYPVENENKLSDSKGNVLPDAYLITKGLTAIEMAFKVHTDLGQKFIGAIDCRTKKKIGKDHELKDGDVIKIIAGR